MRKEGREIFHLIGILILWERSHGLYHIGYTVGRGLLLPKLTQGYRLRFAGQEFTSWEEIFTWASGWDLTKQDTIVRIPPRKVLEYPLEIGKHWVAFDDVWLQTRRVIDKELVTTRAGIFSCYKIEVVGEMWNRTSTIQWRKEKRRFSMP